MVTTSSIHNTERPASQDQVDRSGDLQVCRLAVHDHHRATGRLDQRCVITGVITSNVGGP
tara:strand:- start:473 stop:652 length:180 start_codon:yes stop_codon:yes gene_type:complete